MDISVLFEKPEPNERAVLFIEPLAPLSLVTSMPGAYYRSQREPSNFMIYGMLENLLGWHFSNDGNEKLRDSIIRDLKKYHKKYYKLDLEFEKTPVGFRPLLQYHLKIEKPLLIPHITSYEDYWTQHLKDTDTSLKSKSSHPKGARNYDYQLDFEVNKLYELSSNQRDNEWQVLYNKNEKLFPMYYQSPTKREFIVVEGKYGYSINLNQGLLNLLIHSSDQLAHPLYLGTNEGWVDIKLIKL
jgi:CRISPR-associated protein Cas5